MASQPCPNKSQNAQNCDCTYMSCGKRGFCCACIQQHLASNELPGCCFPPDVEKTHDRSFKRFVQTYKHLLD